MDMGHNVWFCFLTSAFSFANYSKEKLSWVPVSLTTVMSLRERREQARPSLESCL